MVNVDAIINDIQPIFPAMEYWKREVNERIVDEKERQWHYKIIWCESRGDSDRKNSTSSASGLYGYLDSTFKGTCGDLKYKLNGRGQIDCAHKMYNQGRQREWLCN